MNSSPDTNINALEKSPAPCWLWDPAMNRIAWANPAGLRFWGASTIFDILERRFDHTEQVVMFITGCFRELSHAAKQFSQDVTGYGCEEDLSFLSSRYPERYTFKLSLMPLSDGRMGLMHQALTHPFEKNVTLKHAITVDTLPMPAILTDASGGIISQNAAAESFAELPPLLPELIKASHGAGMRHDTVVIDTEFGQRNIQYTLKKTDVEDESAGYLCVFDDVTERKRTEKELLEKLSHTELRNQFSAYPEKGVKSGASESGQLNADEAKKFQALRDRLSSAQVPARDVSEPTPESDIPTEHKSRTAISEVAPETHITIPDTHAARLAELQAILDATMDGIFTLDGTGKIISMNAGAEAIFGRHPVEMIGTEFTSLFDTEGASIVSEYLASLGNKGIASIFNDGREVSGIEKNGGVVPVFLSINPLLLDKTGDEKDSLSDAVFCALVRDITQWKKTETELRRAKDEAEAASIEKSNFLNTLSHEIRTPLNAILGFVELMKMEKYGPLGDKRYKGYLTDIQTSGQHLMGLTTSLLDLARMQAGKMEMDFTSVDVADIIDQSVSILQEEAKRENILIRTDLDDDLPQIVADQGSLRQILLNLMANSIKFSKAGAQVIISSKLAETGEVMITVSDTGIGMDDKELKLALEPFGQTARGKKIAKTTGTGLGLPLSKALTEANRARFHMTSDPKSGTKIEITFPNSRVLTA